MSRSENPFSPPQADVPQPRTGSCVGVIIWLFAALVYVPMTIGPIVMAIVEPEKDFWPKLGASAFNGTVTALLVWLGRWFRRRGRTPAKFDGSK